MPPQNLGLLSTLRTCNVHHSLRCHIRSTNKTNVGQNQVTENNRSSFVYYKTLVLIMRISLLFPLSSSKGYKIRSQIKSHQ